jgi:hypothetical protein
MLKDGERYVLTTGKVSVIQGVLSLLLAGVKSEGAVAPSAYQSLDAFSKNGCDRMILELRTPKETPAGISPKVGNLRVSYIGQVLVVSGEVTSPEILREIERLRRPHFSLQYVASALLAFVHVLLSMF